MRLPTQNLCQGEHRAEKGIYVDKSLTACAVGPDLQGDTSSIITQSLCRALNESRTKRPWLSGAGFVHPLCDAKSGSERRGPVPAGPPATQDGSAGTPLRPSAAEWIRGCAHNILINN